MGLIGRERECAVLDAMLDEARTGLSSTLVIRGEAGIGKTSLLEHAVAHADDFVVVRLTGLESEQEIGYAALHRLLSPILHQVASLPEPQRDALNTALGLASGPPADRFLVGLGTISLAANAARAVQRLLCIVDDAQWIDRQSIEALAFWGRRIVAEGIVLLFAERDDADSRPLEGFQVLEVRGLVHDDAAELVGSRADPGIDPELLHRIVTETGGNPLALVELAEDASAESFLASASTGQPLPMSRRLEERFTRQVRTLPVDTQMFLLLAAADSTGDPTFLASAASLLGVKLAAVEPAESRGLLTMGAELKFRHPLIRSAVYSGARSADLRAVHAALAAADTDHDSERRAWHLAAAAVGRDEELAAQLEHCARRASERGGHSGPVALLVRSAELTPDRKRAACRLVEAADAALRGGAPRQTLALVEAATPELNDGIVAARARRLEGNAWARLGRAAVAAPMLLDAAAALAGSEPALSRHTLLEGVEAVFLAGRWSVGDRELTRQAAEQILDSPPGPDEVIELLLRSFATSVTAGYIAAVPTLRAAVAAMRSEEVRPEYLIRWARFASNSTRALWDHDAHDDVMNRLATVSRERGALVDMAVALESYAASEIWAGRFDSAEGYVARARDLNSAAGVGRLSGELMDLVLLASRGRDREAMGKSAVVMALAADLGIDVVATIAHLALVRLDLGTGRYSDALEHAVQVFAEDQVPFGNEVLPDMVEAGVRAGDLVSAKDALNRLDERARTSATPWALGLLARSRALFDDDAEPQYQASIDLLGTTRQRFELARTHLLYGEWLRRQKRRVDARNELREAHDAFSTMGAEAFAKRARDELLATGERARRRAVDTATDLTPQEAHVANLAAAGNSNAEIAAQLFISTSTVEYHLRKVFRKLSVTSRRQLRRALDRPQDVAPLVTNNPN